MPKMGSRKCVYTPARKRTIKTYTIAFLIAFVMLTCCEALRFGLDVLKLQTARRMLDPRAGAGSKHLYCKLTGGCSQCQEKEEIERYCVDTGFKELLQCTTEDDQEGSFPLVLTYPYPPDVHIDNDRDEGADSTRVVIRSCTEKTVAAHQEALQAEVAAAVAAAGGSLAHMPLFKFELIMCGLLGLSLPVVYWRKIRIRHL
ncbi:hypothetical protein Vretimale_10477 [Volvox reticuliferus]|uniref:Uncharacterized protein n=1 Tax=Volvox reticuliferus TaxID=1737510 RepID=A0A8J4CIN0_9CHLO|nr:hypothetical protein Vretifemale_12494 [Volvox reticuliferus]GIM06207.1 hypothetical protein Vretimale_10477 [Volvox reticuliferus]